MMLKLDENLPEELAELFTERGHDVETVRGEGLVGQADPRIFKAAVDERRVLVTQDLDFSDIRRFTPGTHPGIVLVRLREPSRRRMITRMRQILDQGPIDIWAESFVVVGDRRLRIRRK